MTHPQLKSYHCKVTKKFENYKELLQNVGSDPSKREHENALRRKWLAKKRQQASNGPRRLVNDVDLKESSASMYYDDLLSYPQPF
ncbi:hypothetical protein CDAR_436351 [Caerostris darwini]|uniref:Uncharacterized protein n=1 Tax=Caerostris darwini TaxID=1538125 RepID=A0AAV4RAN6_9ARAC|nr:hypothetical protein CDAR_436351 [Caerostris darwini]